MWNCVPLMATEVRRKTGAVLGTKPGVLSGGTGIGGIPMGPPIGIPAGFCCTLLSGMLLDIIAIAAA